MRKLFLLLPILLLLSSCKSVSPGSDEVVVGAEKTRAISALTFSTLWRLEKDNRLALWAISHDFKHQVDATRTNAPVWIANLTGAIAAYKAAKGLTTQQSLLASEENLLGHATAASKLATSITNTLKTINP